MINIPIKVDYISGEVTTDNVLTASEMNSIISELKHVILNANLSLDPTDQEQVYKAILSIIDTKLLNNTDFMRSNVYDTNGNGIVDNAERVNGHTVESDIPANLTFDGMVLDANYVHTDNNYTTAEKNKLAGLESSRFKGKFLDLDALNQAYQTAEDGDYADVDAGEGDDVKRYVWDSSDSVWIQMRGVSTELTDAEVKQKYENNPDTNAFTDAYKAKLDVELQEKLESGVNIKTINNESILGPGNIDILYNIDGGSASTIYSLEQNLDGGNA